MGPSIYKYYRPDGYGLDSLKNKFLWFSKPPYFNDPFDCSMEHLVTRDSQLSDLGKEFIRTNTKRFGICCFSEDPISHHMWSFYGDGYKGFCVEFDREIIQNFYSDKFFANCDLKKCNYRLIPLDLNELIDWVFHDDGSVTRWPLRKILSENKEADRLFEMLLLQKNERIWKNEKEWRIILSGRAIQNSASKFDQDGKGYKIPLPNSAIKSIIFGSTMDEKIKDKIGKINKDVFGARLELKEIELNHDNWGLNIKKIL